MHSVRLVVLAASLAASLTALPAHAAGGGGAGGGGGGGGGAVPAAPVAPAGAVPAAPPAAVRAVPAAPVTPVRMVGGLFSVDTHEFEGYEVYTRDSAGRVRLSVVYFNTARLPASTVLDVSANGVKVGTLAAIPTANAESLTLTAALPSLGLGSRITVSAAGTPIASGLFILAI